MTNATSDLSAIKSDCLSNGALVALGACNDIPDAGPLTISLDLSPLESLDLSPSVLTTPVNESIGTVIDSLDEAIELVRNLSEIINSEIEPTIADIEISLEEVKTSMREMVDTEVSALVEMVVNDDFNEIIELVEELRDEVRYQVEANEQMNNIQSLFTFLFTGVLLSFLCILGLCLGIVFYSSDLPPSKQSTGANCGGMCSMCSGACGIFQAIFIFWTAAFMFFIGTHLTLICAPLQDLSLLQEVVDPMISEAMGEIDIGEGNTISISVYDMMEGCGMDKGIFDVLGIADSGLFNISGMDAEEFMPHIDTISPMINSSFTSMDLDNSISIDDAFDGLSITSIIDPTLFTDVSDITTLLEGVDLDTTSTDLQTAADNIRGVSSSMADDLEDLKQHLLDTKTDLLEPMIEQTENFTILLGNLNASIAVLMGGTDDVTVAANDLLDYVSEGPEIITQSVNGTLADLGDFANGFITGVMDKIKYDVGSCGIFRLIYDSIVDTFCDDIGSFLNVYSLALILMAIAIIPYIILNVRVAKYSRRSTKSGHKYKSNKVHPGIHNNVHPGIHNI